MVAVAIGGAALLGAGASVYSAGKAADAQKDAASAALANEDRKLEIIRGDLAPYRDAGGRALSYYEDFLGANGPEATSRAHDLFRASPGYSFMVDEGQKAVEGSAAARGGLLSGGALKALQDRRMGIADTTSGSYLDRFLGLANMGQNSAAQTGSFTAGSAARQGGYLTDAGAAQAGGYLAAGQGITGAINNSLKLYGQSQGWGRPQDYSKNPWVYPY